MNVASHMDNLQESTRKIRQAVSEGLIENQRTLGFHASAASADMLEIILHEGNLIDSGFAVKHEWFNSDRKTKEKFPFEFPRKAEIVALIRKIENNRNKLCYGKRQDEELLEQLVKDFNSLKEIFMEATGHEL